MVDYSLQKSSVIGQFLKAYYLYCRLPYLKDGVAKISYYLSRMTISYN